MAFKKLLLYVTITNTFFDKKLYAKKIVTSNSRRGDTQNSKLISVYLINSIKIYNQKYNIYIYKSHLRNKSQM